jgi:membrane-associated phospholipid phosphatase
MTWLKALTDFGDLAVLTPVAALILLWLLFARAVRGAIWWALALAFCAGLTVVFKVFFYACPPLPGLHSPSGHTSFSALVYGAMTLVTAKHTRGWQRIIAIGLGASFILAVAASRLLLAHNALEVGLGLTIGIAALIFFEQSYWRSCRPKIWLSPLFAAGAALLLISHGQELNVEGFIDKIAGYLKINCS